MFLNPKQQQKIKNNSILMNYSKGTMESHKAQHNITSKRCLAIPFMSKMTHHSNYSLHILHHLLLSLWHLARHAFTLKQYIDIHTYMQVYTHTHTHTHRIATARLFQQFLKNNNKPSPWNYSANEYVQRERVTISPSTSSFWYCHYNSFND